MTMTPTERAEARRKAILSRGSDRLNKLTSSARGEDAPQFIREESPRAGLGDKFLGDSSNDMPTPKRASPSPRATPSPGNSRQRTPSNLGEADPSAWSPEQQAQFMQALMGGMPGMDQSANATPAAPQIAAGNDDPGLPSLGEDPLAAMLQQFGLPPPGATAAGKAPPMFAAPQPKPPPTLLRKLLPLFHIIGVWLLLAYFVIYVEPQAHQSVAGLSLEDSADTKWYRWADLLKRKPDMEAMSVSGTGWFVQVVPFFWAFTTLQVAVHSARIFSGLDAVEPPSLVAFALPHLPPPLPSLIINGLKYMQMFNLFMDDLAGLLFGLGFVLVIASYYSTGSAYV